MQETEKIWMNGELVDWADAKVHVGVHGLHYGSGVFEGIRCYDTPKGPAVFRLGDHMQRLHNSARLLHMEHPVLGRRARRGDERAARRERPARVLHPPDRVLRLRRARRRRARQPGRDGDHELAVGPVPRRGGAEERHPRQDLVLAARLAEHRPARLEGDRRVPQLDARGHRGEQRRLRRGDPADARGNRRRRLGREHLRRPRRRHLHAGPRDAGSCPGITRDTVTQIAAGSRLHGASRSR